MVSAVELAYTVLQFLLFFHIDYKLLILSNDILFLAMIFVNIFLISKKNVRTKITNQYTFFIPLLFLRIIGSLFRKIIVIFFVSICMMEIT